MQSTHLVQIHERVEKVANFVKQINIAWCFRKQLLVPIQCLITIFQLLVADRKKRRSVSSTKEALKWLISNKLFDSTYMFAI